MNIHEYSDENGNNHLATWQLQKYKLISLEMNLSKKSNEIRKCREENK